MCATLAWSGSSAHAQLGVNKNRRYDQNSYLGTHNSYAAPQHHYLIVNQLDSITSQLNSGVRYINLDLFLLKQKKVAANWQAIIASDSGMNDDCEPERIWTLDGPAGNFHSEKNWRVAVAHNVYELADKGVPWALITGAGVGDNRHLYLDEHLRDIREWLQSHPNEVVTLGFENNVPYWDWTTPNQMPTHQNSWIPALPGQASTIFDWEVNNSGIKPFLFYLDRPNVGMQVPGRPAGEWWEVLKHGFPTLNQMIAAGKRAVWLPDDGRHGIPTDWRFQVNTVYGNKSLNSDTWTEARGESAAIDDFTRPLFLMEHAPDVSITDYSNVNDKNKLTNRLDDIVEAWNRLPHYLSIDMYFAGDNGGPSTFIRELNGRRAALPTIHPTSTITPRPSPYGWNKSDATINMGGVGDTIRKVVYTKFGVENLTTNWSFITDYQECHYGSGAGSFHTAPMVEAVDPAAASHTLTAEGVTTVSFAAVGTGGNRSNQSLVDVRIDKVKPTVTGAKDRNPNVRGWYNANVTLTFRCRDDRSGIAYCTPTTVLSKDGANQWVKGRAVDKAINITYQLIRGINIDKTAPVISYTGNAGLYTVDQFIAIKCTPSDNLSGVLSHTCKDVRGDAYTFALGSHTYSATVTDRADNTGSGMTRFDVRVTELSLANLTRRFCSKPGVGNALASKLYAAAKQKNDKAKDNILGAYIHQVRAQTRKSIPADKAAILIGYAQVLQRQ